MGINRQEIIPWILRSRNDPKVVYITNNVITELKLPVDNLHSLTTLLGFTYILSCKVRIEGKDIYQ